MSAVQKYAVPFYAFLGDEPRSVIVCDPPADPEPADPVQDSAPEPVSLPAEVAPKRRLKK